MVDDSAATIVMQIFTWAADGTGTYEIARRLNSMRIPSPNTHRADAKAEIMGIWHSRTIDKMLTNEIYLGHLIQGKTKAVNFKRQPAPREEWVYAYDAHEAIVPQELFEAVQAQKKKRHNKEKVGSSKSYSQNIYKGKIYCAYCGGHLERNKNHDKYIFRCVTNRTALGTCIGNRVGEDLVNRSLSEQLLQFRDSLIAQPMNHHVETETSNELSYTIVELDRLEKIIRSLYESLINDLIDQAEYMELKTGYNTKKDELNHHVATLKQALDDEKNAKISLQESVHILNTYADTSKLTSEHIDWFVDRIVVRKDGRVHIELSIKRTNSASIPTTPTTYNHCL
jgi:hypothetical protein